MKHILLLLAVPALIINTTCPPQNPQLQYQYHTVAGAPLPQLDINLTVRGEPRVAALLEPHNIPVNPLLQRTGNTTRILLKNIPYGTTVRLVLEYTNCTTIITVDTRLLEPPYTPTASPPHVHTQAEPPRLVTSTPEPAQSAKTTGEMRVSPDWIAIYALLLIAGLALSVTATKLVKGEKRH